MAGISMNNVGHCHPAVVRAITEQAARLINCSNLYYTEPMIALAEWIRDSSLGGRVFFCNSGTEANEAAIKLVRKRAWRAGQPDRTDIVAIEGSFHGRTLGSLSITIQPAKWEGFAPLPGGVVTVPFDDVAALEKCIGEHTAAVFIEPIQGEVGIRPISNEFAAAARELTTEHGALLVVDEIQTGMGRTGAWLGIEHYGIRPDVVTLAKGLGGGVPAGAMWVDASYVDSFQPSDHGTTQGGNPLACAAAVAVFETIEREGLIENSRRVGESLRTALEPLGTEVRGRGLLIALDLGEPIAGDVVRAGLERGIVVNDVNPTSIRLAPPLIITEEQALEGVEKLSASIDAVRG
jgi:acetylornithine aminotransferase